MALRVTEDEVHEIIDVDSEITTLIPFITAANLLVTERLGTSSLSAAQLKEIERWLAAHFVAVRDRRTSQETLGSANQSFTGKTGYGLEFTPYGQQVLLLDSTGLLSKKARVTFVAMGPINESTV